MAGELTNPVLKVLHLDDDPFELERVQNALEKNGIDCHFQVTSVSTTEKFITSLNSFKPEVAILDIHLDSSATTGVELVNKVRTLSPKTVILMCSSADDVKTIARSLNAGADDFISKKSDKGELSLRVYNSYRLGQIRIGGQQSQPGRKPKNQFVGATIEQVAKRAPMIIDSAITAIFIRGESGTGKEVVSDVFESQLGGTVPFIKVNCGAIAPTLLESELFGHVKGAFTGASTDKRGLFESASGGWIFLDEVATLSKSAQVALLRVLENQEVRRVGSSKATKINVRVLSATNESIQEKIAAGEFRQDLWQRLCEVELELPALRDRIDEIDAIVEHFCKIMSGGPYKISGPALDVLKSVSWKQGNIRELRNCLRAMTEMHVEKLLTPLAIPARIWDEIGETAEEQPQTRAQQVSGDHSTLNLPWNDDQPMSYEFMADKLLLEMTRKLSESRGKMSLRSLALTIGMSRSTLSGRLKSLVHKNVIPIEELVKFVGVSEK
jgi:DNA-binding NtrC family response regulator